MGTLTVEAPSGDARPVLHHAAIDEERTMTTPLPPGGPASRPDGADTVVLAAFLCAGVFQEFSCDR
jgi:hypothetical protein